MLACIANVAHTTLTYAHNYILLSLSLAHCHTHSAGFDCKGVASVWCCIVGVIYKGNRNNLQLHCCCWRLRYDSAFSLGNIFS